MMGVRRGDDGWGQSSREGLAAAAQSVSTVREGDGEIKSKGREGMEGGRIERGKTEG